MLVSGDWEELSRKFLEMFQGLIDEITEGRIARALQEQRDWFLEDHNEEELEQDDWYKPAHCTFCGRGGIKLRCRRCEEKRLPEHNKIRSAGVDSEYTDNPENWCVDCGRECGPDSLYGLRCRDCGNGELCFCYSEFCSLEEPHSDRCERKREEQNLKWKSYDPVKKQSVFNCFCHLKEDSETEESDVEASEPVKEIACELMRSRL